MKERRKEGRKERKKGKEKEDNMQKIYNKNASGIDIISSESVSQTVSQSIS